MTRAETASRLGYMAIRNHRTPEWSIDGLDADDPTAEVSTTRLKPWRVETAFRAGAPAAKPAV
ncbi:MAG: hypothetical protein H0V92_01005 [Pseudonocardiales bacterium]|nr:hypothetical protein [Pseudonocardiales bacterium]